MNSSRFVIQRLFFIVKKDVKKTFQSIKNKVVTPVTDYFHRMRDNFIFSAGTFACGILYKQTFDPNPETNASSPQQEAHETIIQNQSTMMEEISKLHQKMDNIINDKIEQKEANISQQEEIHETEQSPQSKDAFSEINPVNVSAEMQQAFNIKRIKDLAIFIMDNAHLEEFRNYKETHYWDAIEESLESGIPKDVLISILDTADFHYKQAIELKKNALGGFDLYSVSLKTKDFADSIIQNTAHISSLSIENKTEKTIELSNERTEDANMASTSTSHLHQKNAESTGQDFLKNIVKEDTLLRVLCFLTAARQFGHHFPVFIKTNKIDFE